MRGFTRILMGAGLLVILAGPAEAQLQDWQRKWFWGAQYGLMYFHDGTDWRWATNIGGHWLITGRRAALYLAYDQMFFRANTQVAVDDGSGTGTTQTVTLDDGFRLQGAVLLYPLTGHFQPYIGGGLAIHQANSEEDEIIDDISTRAFAHFMGGLQLRLSGSIAVYGNYQFVPGSNRFAISSDSHIFSTGLRIALGNAHEDINVQH